MLVVLDAVIRHVAVNADFLVMHVMQVQHIHYAYVQLAALVVLANASGELTDAVHVLHAGHVQEAIADKILVYVQSAVRHMKVLDATLMLGVMYHKHLILVAVYE